MGAHTRARGRAPGRHRGELAPLFTFDLELGAAAGRAGMALGAVGTVATAVVGGATGAGAAPAVHAASTVATSTATANDFARLRACESSGNYRDNTGNGYYGAYQFDLRTWEGLGYSGLPSNASPATQDQGAARLQAARGWEPWPACSARLGLGRGTASRGSARASLAPIAGAASVAVALNVPSFPGHVLNAGMANSHRADVVIWQSRMARRGWRIVVDGYFGPHSSLVAAEFAAEKGLHSARPGTVDGPTWRAAWTAPIT